MKNRLAFLLAVLGGQALAQSVSVQSDVWLDTYPGQVYAYVGVSADYDSFYWYNMNVTGYLYEGATYRGYCAAFGDYYSVSCGVSTPKNPGSEYVIDGYINVEATYYAPGPINVPVTSPCYTSSCFWDYFGYSYTSVPGAVPSFATYFAPLQQVSIPVSTSKQYRAQARKVAPGPSPRQYQITTKGFIPYDNLYSYSPLDVCHRWVAGQATPFPLFYAGNMRRWNYDGTAKAWQFYWVTPNRARSETGASSHSATPGEARTYPIDALIADSSSPSGYWIDYMSIPPWDPLWDCTFLHGKANTEVSGTMTPSRQGEAKVLVTHTASAANPLSFGSSLGPVEWQFGTVFEESYSGQQVHLRVSGSANHKCYPAHEIWVDGTRVYSFSPTGPSTVIPCLTGISPRIVTTIPTQTLVY